MTRWQRDGRCYRHWVVLEGPHIALPVCSYNVLLTTYEFVMKDKSFLRRTHWQFIIIGAHSSWSPPLARFTSRF